MLPFNETQRLMALRRTQLLDTPPEERFDRVTRLTAKFFDVQICLFSLVDEHRQWFKSKTGLDVCETERDISFCTHAIQESDVFVINDASEDIRFAQSPLVTGKPYIQFYAGAQIRDPSGLPIGVLCIVDSMPRAFSKESVKVLRDFADIIESEIVRVSETELLDKISSSALRTSSIIESFPDMVFVINRHLQFLVCKEHKDLPKKPSEFIGKKVLEVLPNVIGRQISKNVLKAFSSENLDYHDFKIKDVDDFFEARYSKINDDEVLVIIRNTTEEEHAKNKLELLSEVARQTTNGIVITDNQGRILWVNESFTLITGYNSTEAIGKKTRNLLQGKDTDPNITQFMLNSLNNMKGFDVEVLNYKKDGTPYWVRVICTPIVNHNKKTTGFVHVQVDITKQKNDEEKISKNEKLLKAVIDTNHIGTWHLNVNTGELFINDKWAELLGYTLNELKPINRSTWEKLTHPEDLVDCELLLKEHISGKTKNYDANIRMRHKNGKWVWIHTQGRISSHNNDGSVEWLLGTHIDINSKVTTEHILNSQSIKTQAIVENMLDGVISIDIKGVIQTFNRAAEVIFGYKRDEVIGKNVSLLMDSPYRENHDQYLAKHLSGISNHVTKRTRELEALHKNGTNFPIELGLVEVKHLDEITFVGIVRDITHRKQRDKEIHQLAFYDSLTQLPNRRLLIERLQSMVDKCSRHLSYGALLFLDLDNFKSLNDSAGHNTGDLLLNEVASRLLNSVRKSDTVSRWGGDEFVVVIEELGTDIEAAANNAERAAENIIHHLATNYDLQGLSYICSASIGVTLFNSDSKSIDELLKQADMAMYKAKSLGRNCVHFFDPEMQRAVSIQAKMEQELHDALTYQHFLLYYQKQVDNLGKTIGAEVLLRWKHPIKGLISPADFIPLTESTGLIVPIGQWVLEQACLTLVDWSNDPSTEQLTISVNISLVQFGKKDFVSSVLDIVQRTGANPKLLKLEVTETLLATDIHTVKSKMLALKHYGISFSIDDFGTGYSSLLYLQQMPIDQLKIDKSFVSDITSNSNNKAISQAVITLANSMNINVIAEGVELLDQQLTLQELGCNTFQGYLYGKPCGLNGLL